MDVTRTRATWFIAVAALAVWVAGVVLSRRVEPGVRVEATTLAGGTPALRFLPVDAGPHPVALLAHGVTASKETLFRFGEALAAAGFVAISVDLPGHGESTRSFFDGENVSTLERAARSLGAVDVFLGHSMGAYAGAEGVRDGRLSPKLFVAVGALPDLGERGPPLLLLAGRFDEAVSMDRLRAQGGARLVLSSWSDHALEPYDPHLVHAAVEAACRAVGRPSPASPRCWRARLAGMVLGLLGALVLGFHLPRLFLRLARVRGLLLAAIALVTVAVTAGTWLSAAPIPRRVPLQVAAVVASLLVVFGAARLRVPRWSPAVLAVVSALACVAVGAYFPALFASLLALVLLAGTVLAWIAARGGTRKDGDLAFAIFVGYAIGQWMPTVF